MKLTSQQERRLRIQQQTAQGSLSRPSISESEMHRIVYEWNQTSTDYPRDSCIHELFEAQAEQTPDSIALVFDGQKVCYQELNRRANQLAHFLGRHGVGPEKLVGIHLERGIEMIVGMLGILKAGGAFLPVSPTYPQEQLSYMIKDGRVSILLTQERLSGVLQPLSAQVICLDSDWKRVAEQSNSNPRSGAIAENLAYVMYTSGSTGIQKGVCVIHRGVVRLVKQTNYVKLSPEEGFLQLAPISFDASTFEIWGCLLNGGRLTIMPPHTPSMEEIGEAINQYGVSTLWLTSALFQQMVETNPAGLSGIRQLLVGGDVLPVTQVRKILGELKGLRLINGYGPTECTTFTCCYEMTDIAQVGKQIPIGRPIANTQVYLLDKQLRPVPIGETGELYAGGDGLARGYLNSPEMTAEKFIPNPFGGEPGARLYRTGDLARYLPDGNIEFLGRVDHQVKILGFRIEPEEIQATLNQHPAVRESVVIAREGSAAEKRLVAYIVPNRDYEEAGQQKLKEQLKDERLWQWQEIYNEVIYQGIDDQTSAQRDPKFNITGWDSSYTGLPLSQEEMREQVDQTVDRVLSMRPASLLEIGCGAGLLLFRIAPHCKKYWGTDFSEVALHHVHKQLAEPQERLPQVALFHRPAHDFMGIESESFDGVILNSVTQHLPSIEYLVRVLEGAVDSVKSGGFIFVGDVRCLALLKAFHASVQLYHSPSSLTLDEFERLVQRQVCQEEELIIDPAFFTLLRQHLRRIRHVEVYLKRGRHHNELTRFRYDVILHIGKELYPTIELRWLDWQKERLTPDRVSQILQQSKPEVLGIKGVPNARLTAELKALELTESRKRPETVGQLREIILREPREGVDPEEYWALSEAMPYRVDITWSDGGNPGCYDVLIRRRESGRTAVIEKADPPLSKEPIGGCENYANNPLRRILMRKLGPQLRRYLKKRLPDYMIPSAFVVLDALPLTANGKIDRRALPSSDNERPELDQAFVAPGTHLEELIAAIWQKLLGIEQVGIYDDFFELGGDSLKAVQVVGQLRRSLGIEISTISLFEKTTISALAQALSSEKSEQDQARRISLSRELAEKRRAKRLERFRRLNQ